MTELQQAARRFLEARGRVLSDPEGSEDDKVELGRAGLALAELVAVPPGLDPRPRRQLEAAEHRLLLACVAGGLSKLGAPLSSADLAQGAQVDVPLSTREGAAVLGTLLEGLAQLMGRQELEEVLRWWLASPPALDTLYAAARTPPAAPEA